MASISYFVLSPSGILALIGLLHGPDKTIPTPPEDYKDAIVDMLIPAHNEEFNIAICLESVSKQTRIPNNIILIDDGSSDNTALIATKFAESIGIDLKVMRRKPSTGKTQSVHEAALNSKADVLFVLDSDTTLRSANYVEEVVKNLYQGVGIACACGVILPEFERDRSALTTTPEIEKFAVKYPSVKRRRDTTWLGKLEHSITNNYREELYLFLQKFIYHGEMVFFGSIINPVGCAVAYRREYLLDTLDHYHKILGHNLSTSEDIFIGFAFADKGYRNIQVQNVYALTLEPRLTKLPKQIMLWSSAFLQCCFYFNSLVCTPFKSPRLLVKKVKDYFNPEMKKIMENRKIKEAYRQSFGVEITKKYGRPIGWFIFTSLFEKIVYTTTIFCMVILGLWEPLMLTILVEVTIYTILIAMMHKNRRIRNLFKSILFTPIRYFVLLFDYVVLMNFAKDIWITGNREWKK